MLRIDRVKWVFVVVMILLGVSVTSEGLLGPILVKTVLANPDANPFVHFSNSPLDLTPNILESQASQVQSVLSSTTALLSLWLTPFIGAVSDKRGRKPVLIISLIAFVADYILLTLAYWQSLLWCMLLAKVAGALAMTHTSLCAAYMSDLFPQPQRAKAFGYVAASIGVGLAIGPSTVGYFGKNNFFIGLGIGLTCVILALLVMCFMEESLYHSCDYDEVAISKQVFHCSKFFNPFSTLSVVLTKTNMFLTGLTIVFIIYGIAVTDVTSTMVLYLNYRYDWDLLKIGLCDSLMGVLMCINQGLLLPIYERKLGLRKLLVCCFVVSTFSHLAYAFSFKWWIFVAAMSVASAGFAGHPTIQALITNAEAPNKRGAVLGAMGALQSLCICIGDLVMLNLYSYCVSGKGVITYPGPQFFLGSFLFAMAAVSSAILFYRFSEKRVKETLIISIQAEDMAAQEDHTKPLLGGLEDDDA